MHQQHHQQHYYHCSPASLTPLSPFPPFWNHQHQLATFARWNILYLGWPSGYLTAGQTGGQTSTGLKDKGLQLKVVSDFFPRFSERKYLWIIRMHGFYVHVMLIMVWLWTLKSISLHVPSTALFVNERGRYLWLPCRWPRWAGTGFDFHPSENRFDSWPFWWYLSRMKTWTSARVWWLLQPRVSYQLDCEGWFLNCKVSFE